MRRNNVILVNAGGWTLSLASKSWDPGEFLAKKLSQIVSSILIIVPILTCTYRFYAFVSPMPIYYYYTTIILILYYYYSTIILLLGVGYNRCFFKNMLISVFLDSLSSISIENNYFFLQYCDKNH